MFDLNVYHKNFLQDIYADAESRSLQAAQSFREIVSEELMEIGDLPSNFIGAHYSHSSGNLRLEASGYAYDGERNILYVTVNEFLQEEDIETLSTKVIEQRLSRARRFIIKSMEGLYRELEETSDAFEMSYNIYDKFKANRIDRIKIMLLSDGKISRAYKKKSLEPIESMEVEYSIVDIEYLFNNYKAQNADASFTVDMRVPALKVPLETDKYESYLAYLTGDQIYEIYDKYGKKLLEQNVRTFLQFRGGVNKGIRNTIEGSPEMFFAYNNGITATASEVEYNAKGEITKLHNLQIVNGGQTTSAIYSAKKNNKLDISKVSVQMKLSVVGGSESHSDFVASVAEYANTQNKVNKSDFFSNSPFHKEFKTYSQRVWSPSISHDKELWFYERVRGEYLNEQAYLTSAEKKKFEAIHPRNKKIDKTMLAKAEMVWLPSPHIVSKGAQESFLSFARYITEVLEKDHLAITEEYYKSSIAKIIIFKQVEKLVSAAPWYNGGFRANIVAYTISYLSYIVKKKKKFFDFMIIWEEQELPKDLQNLLLKIAEEVSEHILNPQEGSGNPAQWSKKEVCWTTLQKKEIALVIPSRYLISEETQRTIKKEEIEQKKMDENIDAQIFMVQLKPETRKQLLEYFSRAENKGSLTYTQYSILESYGTDRINIPTDKQAQILYKVYEKALEEGVVMD